MFLKRKFSFFSFSDFDLKVVSVDFSLPTPKIIYYDQTQIPAGIVFDNAILDLIRFKEEVRKFLFRNLPNLETNKLIFAINEQEVYFNQFTSNSTSEKIKDEIEKFLQTRLPYDLAQTTVHYKKITPTAYQILSTKQQLIKDITSIFENTDFILSKLELLPFACLNLLKNESQPYIFVLAEDQSLEFALVDNNILVFSSSLKLKKSLADSQEAILKTIKKIISEYDLLKATEKTLQNIFIVGEDTEVINALSKDLNLNSKTINLADKFSGEKSSEITSYSKALLLASSFNSTISFSANDIIGISEKQKVNVSGMFFSKKILIFIGILLILIGFFVLRPILLESKKTNTTGSSQKQIKKSINKTVASDSAKKLPSTPPAVILNRTDMKIQILNGTTTKGLAAKTKDFLVSKGWVVAQVGNAETTDVTQTQVRFKPSKEALLADLTSTLSERYSVIRGDRLNENDQFDFIIILGRN